jgi:uncharacterized membrane protein YozB (DUF420 family)
VIPLSYLPPLNASLNAVSAILLIAGFSFIRSRRRAAHRRCMIGALVASTIFLISYLTYHTLAGTTRYTGTGWMRTAYFTLLTSHTILAVTVPPLAILTLVRAVQERFDRHRRIARITFPIWLYVSTTGVVIYLMLRGSYEAAP